MVANRLLAPCSKLYCWEQWLAEDIRITGTSELELHHLYRAMDCLEANKESIEEAIYFRLSDLLNLDVDIIFYDTTSLHFEVDEDDRGAGPDDTVTGSKPAGKKKKYKAPRKRGYPKNGRWDAPQIVVGLAVTRDGVPVRHWVFPGNTVDVTTVKQVKEELRGWKLTRCVFVGDRLFDDVWGAAQVGMRTILVPHSDIPPEQVGPTLGEPDAVVHRLAEVHAVVRRWRSAAQP